LNVFYTHAFPIAGKWKDVESCGVDHAGLEVISAETVPVRMYSGNQYGNHEVTYTPNLAVLAPLGDAAVSRPDWLRRSFGLVNVLAVSIWNVRGFVLDDCFLDHKVRAKPTQTTDVRRDYTFEIEIRTENKFSRQRRKLWPRDGN